MNVPVLAVAILGTFGRTAVRPSPLTYNPAVIFTLNQDTGCWTISVIRLAR
jgi:hypothetical protein